MKWRKRILALIVMIVVLIPESLAQESKEKDAMQKWHDHGNEKPVYSVKAAALKPELSGRWEGAAWKQAETVEVTNFFPSGDFRPVTQVRALHGEDGLYIHFRVQDQYVLSTRTEYHGEVWKDACAEFFVQPKPDRGYFNFEINAGGTMLLSYHEHPEYKGEDKNGSVPWALASTVQLYHSLPHIMAPETAEPVAWQLEYFIPFALLEEYVGPLGDVAGQQWRANFYKCAEDNSHPHWGAWSPVIEEFDFHQPRFFGVLKFE